MILGTAGHVDHGKTTLVRALTGVETDRLAEERRRGMSIDLGFAYAGEGEARFGIVDVPGHERFLATMVAGVSGIHAVLFCIAADEGPRAQTREHLRVLDLLGIARGIVVLTRADRADAARIAAVAAETRALLAGTGLADAPILPVSAVTGAGMGALRAAIDALRVPPSAPDGAARLAVDRAFVIDGAGVVAAGLLSAGRLAAGDTVVVSPAGIPARVRALRANDRPAATASAGTRVAVNLAGDGIAAAVVSRGDWIVAPRLHGPTARVDARLIGVAGRLPRAGTLHAGAAQVPLRIDPLGEGFAALALGRALPLLAGDRLLLRGPVGDVLCSGVVLDPAPPSRGRRAPARLAQLAALGLGDDAAAASLLALPYGRVDAEAFARARNRDNGEAMWARLGAVRLGRWAVAPPAWSALAAAVERRSRRTIGRRPNRPAWARRPCAPCCPIGRRPTWSTPPSTGSPPRGGSRARGRTGACRDMRHRSRWRNGPGRRRSSACWPHRACAPGRRMTSPPKPGSRRPRRSRRCAGSPVSARRWRWRRAGSSPPVRCPPSPRPCSPRAVPTASSGPARSATRRNASATWRSCCSSGWTGSASRPAAARRAWCARIGSADSVRQRARRRTPRQRSSAAAPRRPTARPRGPHPAERRT